MNLKKSFANAALAGMAVASLSGCASYGPVEARWNATPVLAPVRAIAQKVESGINELSVGVVARGGIVNGTAEVRTQRNNPIDITPDLNTSGSLTIANGESQFARDCRSRGYNLEVRYGTEVCVTPPTND